MKLTKLITTISFNGRKNENNRLEVLFTQKLARYYLCSPFKVPKLHTHLVICFKKLLLPFTLHDYQVPNPNLNKSQISEDCLLKATFYLLLAVSEKVLTK